jgi:hypothetical protein
MYWVLVSQQILIELEHAESISLANWVCIYVQTQQNLEILTTCVQMSI